MARIVRVLMGVLTPAALDCPRFWGRFLGNARQDWMRVRRLTTGDASLPTTGNLRQV